MIPPGLQMEYEWNVASTPAGRYRFV